MLDNYITRCHRRLGSVTVGVSWGQDASERSLSDARLSSPARMRKKCCYGQKNLGSLYSSLSPSPAHLSHTTNINPFENKAWEIYFYKEVCSFVYWSRHYRWLCFCNIFAWLYNIYTFFYNSCSVKKKPMMQCVNTKILHKLIYRKNNLIKRKRKLKTSVPLENNQPALQYPAPPPKKKHRQLSELLRKSA